MLRMSSQAASTSPCGLSTPSPHTTARGLTPSCMPAMRSWNTRALAMMAQAMRRVWGTLDMPNRRAMDGGDACAGLVQLVQQPCGAVDALLERGGGPVHGALWDGDQAHHVRQVLNAAVQPAGLREATARPLRPP